MRDNFYDPSRDMGSDASAALSSQADRGSQHGPMDVEDNEGYGLP